MKLKRQFILIVGLVLVTLVSGCGKQAPPNIDIQKKVVDTYLQSLKEGNKTNLMKTLDVETAQMYMQDPELLDKLIRTQKAMGSIQKWEYTGEPQVDEVNNQVLMDVNVRFPRSAYKLKFDVRKSMFTNSWLIYGADAESSKKMKQLINTKM